MSGLEQPLPRADFMCRQPEKGDGSLQDHLLTKQASQSVLCPPQGGGARPRQKVVLDWNSAACRGGQCLLRSVGQLPYHIVCSWGAGSPRGSPLSASKAWA